MPSSDTRLTAQREIRTLFEKGVAHRGDIVVLIRRRVEEGPRKVLFVASRRVGNAVRRNRAKRVMRAAHRCLAPGIRSDAVHLAWIARPACTTVKMDEVRTEMAGLLTGAGLMARAAGRS